MNSWQREDTSDLIIIVQISLLLNAENYMYTLFRYSQKAPF